MSSTISFLRFGLRSGYVAAPTRAHVLGFTTITARGFDVARAQIQRARLLARDLCGMSGVNLTFDVADLTGELPEADASVDLTLCLYSVLSHLPVASLRKISAEIARVTSGHSTVRSVGQYSDPLREPVEGLPVVLKAPFLSLPWAFRRLPQPA